MKEGISESRVVRLNAEMFPVAETERRLFDRYGLKPVEIEVAQVQQIIPHVRDAHAVCVISASLPRPSSTVWPSAG